MPAKTPAGLVNEKIYQYGSDQSIAEYKRSKDRVDLLSAVAVKPFVAAFTSTEGEVMT